MKKLFPKWRRKIDMAVIAVCVGMIIAICYFTKEPRMTVGINIENMDLTINPGDDFYDFATLGWRRANPIPAEFSQFGTFDKLRELVLKQTQDIILELAGRRNRAGSIEHKIATLYNTAMDFDTRNEQGISPVLPKFAEIDALKMDNFPAFLGNMQKTRGAFWSDGVGIDNKDSDHYLFGLGQGGVGLARDFMLGTDARSKEVRKRYLEYMTAVFEMFGITDAPAKAVYDMEMKMVKSFFPKEKLRDPHANYNKFSIADFKREFSGFDWDAYFTARGVEIDYIDVGQPPAIKESIRLINTLPAETIRAYLKWRVANGAMTVLGDDQYDLTFDFYSKFLSGTEERRPKWKDATMLVDSVLGEAVGQIYVRRHFPPAAKRRMEKLVENLRRAYSERIDALDWMTDVTKAHAQEKLAAFGVKIGYPDRWRDLSGLEIKGDSLYNDLKRASLFEDAFWREKLRGRKVDRNMWFMNPHTVNAYYSPSRNEIVFPAGILQPPFFDMAADDAFNYGAIGVVIGHEMTHGFDDSGRHFDANGNMTDWWTEEDAAAFKKRADVMVKFFNKIEVLPGVFANGTFTLGENLADQGGLVISFHAFDRFATRRAHDDRFTPEQRFFIANAGVWAANVRDEHISTRTKTAVHSLPQNRVNGIVPHVDAWYAAFDVTSENKMYVPKEKRVRLW